MGAALADAGSDLALLDGELIKPSAVGGEAGQSLLTALNDAHAGLIKVRADLDRAQKAADRVAISSIPAAQQATFGKARADIGIALSGLAEFDRLTPILIDVLGGNDRRQFLRPSPEHSGLADRRDLATRLMHLGSSTERRYAPGRANRWVG